MNLDASTVPCELCGQPTTSTGTLRCDRCWELEKRIRADKKLAAKILVQQFGKREAHFLIDTEPREFWLYRITSCGCGHEINGQTGWHAYNCKQYGPHPQIHVREIL